MKKLALIVSTAALCWMLPAAAFASSDCTTDADCGDGFVCESYQEPCAGVPCVEGEDCTDTCNSEEVYECQPAPPESCTSAADCDSGLVCVTYTWEVCDGGAPQVDCIEGEDCDTGAGEDVTCTTESDGYCVPPYLAPCDTDSDCGTGFSCVEAESCACSGSGGSVGTGTDPDGSVDAGYYDIGSSDEDCSCSGTGQFYCELDETECADATDCAGDLVCDELPWSGGDISTCAVDPDGETSCEEDAGSGQEATTYCQPEDLQRWAAYGGGSAADAARLADNESGSGSSGEGAGGSSDLVSSDVDRSGVDSDGSSESSESGAACASTGVNGAAPYGAAGIAVALFGLVALRRRRGC